MRFLVLSILLLTLGCSSLHEQAELHYNNGEYLAASSIYLDILMEDPTDSVAKERLNKSRQKLIEQRLIEVRQQRLSNDFYGAIRKLISIQHDEAVWNISPSGTAFSTQAEELSLLYNWFEQEVNLKIKNLKPLKAEIFFNENKTLFINSSFNSSIIKLSQKIAQSGKNHCAILLNSISGIYSKDFVTNYCIYWGLEEKNQKRDLASELNLNGPKYGSIIIEGQIENLPNDVLNILAQSFFNGLKNTVYYSTSGEPLTIKINGQFYSNYSEKMSLKIHSYEESIPYEKVVSVPERVAKPHTSSYNTNCSVLSNTVNCSQTPTTDYTYETVYHNVRQTAYRSETRTMNYPAVDYKVSYLLIGKVFFKLEGVSNEFPLNHQLEINDYYSEAQNLNIGLKAREKNYLNEVDWLKEKFGEFTALFKNTSFTVWENKYCSTPQNFNQKQQLENILKCLKGTSKKYEFIDNWFFTNFEMSFEEYDNALKRF